MQKRLRDVPNNTTCLFLPVSTRWRSHSLCVSSLLSLPPSFIVGIGRNVILRSICFIIRRPDVQNRGIQSLLKFTERRCSDERYRKSRSHVLWDVRLYNARCVVSSPRPHNQMQTWSKWKEAVSWHPLQAEIINATFIEQKVKNLCLTLDYHTLSFLSALTCSYTQTQSVPVSSLLFVSTARIT